MQCVLKMSETGGRIGCDIDCSNCPVMCMVGSNCGRDGLSGCDEEKLIILAKVPTRQGKFDVYALCMSQQDRGLQMRKPTYS